jgi:acetyl-CoA carboxylase biotin carboxyl carrier protein
MSLKGAILAGMKRVVSNMAGVVLEFLVKPGEKISVDQDVVMLESMKMQIPVQSSVEGTVKDIKVHEGDFVDDGDVLIEVE